MSQPPTPFICPFFSFLKFPPSPYLCNFTSYGTLPFCSLFGRPYWPDFQLRIGSLFSRNILNLSFLQTDSNVFSPFVTPSTFSQSWIFFINFPTVKIPFPPVPFYTRFCWLLPLGMQKCGTMSYSHAPIWLLLDRIFQTRPTLNFPSVQTHLLSMDARISYKSLHNVFFLLFGCRNFDLTLFLPVFLSLKWGTGVFFNRSYTPGQFCQENCPF